MPVGGNAGLPQGNHRQQGAGPLSVRPVLNTPRKDGATLNVLIRSLENEWQLGLQPRDQTWSPSKTVDRLDQKVCGQLKRLYYSPGPELEEALNIFRKIAPGFQDEERLGLLHKTLKSQTMGQKNSSVGRKQTPLAVETKKLETLSSVKLSANDQHHQKSRSLGKLHIKRDDLPAPDPGSPTDEDEEEYIPPASPTTSSRSAQRRVQASPRFQLGPMVRKRPSDGSSTGKAAKLTIISKEKQPSNMPQDARPPEPASPPFKKPSLENSRSFQRAQELQSFTSTSSNTVSSSQQTRPDTAMTSFTEDPYDGDVCYPPLTRTSSTTMGFLSDKAMFDVDARLEQERDLRKYLPRSSYDSTRESSSTYGSIDEPGLVETSNGVETSFRVEPEFAIPYPKLKPAPDKWRAQDKIPANTTSPVKAQTGLTHYIRDIPDQNLFVDELPEELMGFRYFVLFICCRLANANNMSMSELMAWMRPQQYNSTTFWECMKNHPKTINTSQRDPLGVWSAGNAFEGFTFKGRVTLRQSSKEPVFKLELLPIVADKSCRFQRKFGSDRFLYLNLPPFQISKQGPRWTGEDLAKIQEHFKIWFHKEHSFLGRKWRAFHIEPIRSKKGKVKDDNSDRRMVMFATEGLEIDEPMSIGEMLNWFFPFASNSQQTFCKAYARVDLGLSRTIPTLVFKPSQIDFVRDIKADGAPEDTRFDDPDRQLIWDKAEKGEVMNDGCSRMSVGAALEIWKTYKKVTNSREAIPSVFQGRIGGAKGMWMVCGEPSTNDPDELKIWIEIADSQLKFQAHDDDSRDDRYDPHRLTFEYVAHSSSPASSELHISFIPIMVDRGVPQQDVAQLMTDRLDTERAELLDVLLDPVKTYHWLHQHNSADPDPPWQAALPQSLPNKIRHLLQSGFYPACEPYLANILYRYIKKEQLLMEQKLKVSLGKSTFLYGVADPYGILAPGEIHVDFSSPFIDELTGATYRALNNIDLLVARQPACRRSDIQKVRAVKKMELSHLVDVVVFPSRGQYPMAGKLQGGDYDGDTFWLCWEPILVEPFKNAPAPLKALIPGKYGIEKDSRKLHEVMNPHHLSTVDKLLEEVLEFRMAPSLLGMVTVFLEQQAYKENKMYSYTLDALCDMHDLLVDAPKNGYSFSQDDWSHLIHRKLKCGKSDTPAYKQAMNDCEDAKELGEADKVREKDYSHNDSNVLDYLYFEIVRAHDVATLKLVKEAFPKDFSDDSALQLPYKQLLASGSDAIKAELSSLVKDLRDLDKTWTSKLKGMDKVAAKSEYYNQTVDSCYSNFRSYVPASTDSSITPLLTPYLHPDFHIWDYIRASALYTELPKPKRHTFVWHMAARELAALKCAQIPGSVYVTGSIFSNMKPKPIKVPRPEEHEDDVSEDEFQTAKESFSVRESPKSFPSPQITPWKRNKPLLGRPKS